MLLKDSDVADAEKLAVLYEMDKVLGFNLKNLKRAEAEELSQELMELVKEREEARKNKDWQRADELRELLLKKGLVVKDTPDGTKWMKNV